jgi:hypothetical protein
VPVNNGFVSFYNGSWSGTVNLGPGHQPTAAIWSQTGASVWLVTVDDYLFNVSASGTILSSVQVPVPPGWLTGTPLGLSGLAWFGGSLYGCSSMNGALVAF